MQDAFETRPRLLIAEDDRALAATMREVLAEDFTVDMATDGREAVAQVRRHLPDVVVMDVEMPRMDGLDACRALRRDPTTAALPILVVTGSAEPTSACEAFDAGATDYLPKPFSISQLRSRARTLVLRCRAS